MKNLVFAAGLALALTAAGSVHAQHSKVEYKTRHAWSHRKKDALIGAGAGAVTGAIVGHGAKGAVVGGVVGGGAGYLLGRHKDRKYPEDAHRTTYVYKRKRD